MSLAEYSVHVSTLQQTTDCKLGLTHFRPVHPSTEQCTAEPAFNLSKQFTAAQGSHQPG
uniref:Gpm77 n=1 Tax=Arundo donax TaxID=35708 RepID=A0A0A9G247_ARUDO